MASRKLRTLHRAIHSVVDTFRRRSRSGLAAHRGRSHTRDLVAFQSLENRKYFFNIGGSFGGSTYSDIPIPDDQSIECPPTEPLAEGDDPTKQMWPSTGSTPTPPTTLPYVPSSSGENSSVTNYPVRASDGTPVVGWTDLQSNGFGSTFSIQRSWGGLNYSGNTGNGWVNSSMPQLMIIGGEDEFGFVNFVTFAVIETGSQNQYFYVDENPSALVNLDPVPGERASQSTLEYDAATNKFIVRYENGSVARFNDLPRLGGVYLSNTREQGIGSAGQISSFTDAGGFTTTYEYDGAGRLSAVERRQPLEAEVEEQTGAYERFVYTYATISNSSTNSSTEITTYAASIEWKRGTYTIELIDDEPLINDGTLTTVRSVEYTYYTGEVEVEEETVDDENGRLGDLKSVKVYDGEIDEPNLIDQQYYRYYKFSGMAGDHSQGKTANESTAHGPDKLDPRFGDNVIFSGLKTVVFGDSLDRLIDNVEDYETESDANIRPYINHEFQYERWSDTGSVARSAYNLSTRYRAVSELAQGAGCSACTGGQGLVRMSFASSTNDADDSLGYDVLNTNAWRTRLNEFMPDSTPTWGDNDRFVYYTNEVGKVMLKLFVDVSSTAWTVSSVSRPTAGQLILTASSGSHGIGANDKIALTGVLVGSTNELFDGIFTVASVSGADITINYSTDLEGSGGTLSLSGDAALAKVLSEHANYNSFDSDGRLTLVADAAMLQSYSEAYPDLINSGAGLSDSLGQAVEYLYGTSDGSGDADGYLKTVLSYAGEADGTPDILSSYTYEIRTEDGSNSVHLASYSVYPSGDDESPVTTNYTYYWDGTHRPASITTDAPAVLAAQNGPDDNTALAPDTTRFSEITHFDANGRPTWRMDAAGHISYTSYDYASGGVLSQITDVDTDVTGDFANKPSGWTNASGLHLKSVMEVDALGRVTKSTDPNQRVDYTIYDDAAQEVRLYRGVYNDSGTYKTTLPILILRETRSGLLSYDVDGDGTIDLDEMDQPVSFIDTIVSSVSATFDTGVPTGAESITGGSIKSFERAFYSVGDQYVVSRSYSSMDSVTYDHDEPEADLGAAGDNYLETTYGYDNRGRLARVLTPDNTWTHTVYDGLGRVKEIWKGTDHTDWTHDDPGNSGGSGNNMVKIAAYEYDGNGVGNSNLTKSIAYGTTGSINTVYQYDYRNRQIGERAANKVATKWTYDNADQVTVTETYADADADFVIDSGELRGKTTTAFNAQGQIYQSSVFNVHPTSGTLGNSLTSNYWYDARGQLIKTSTPTGIFNKYQYDGVGRLSASYVSYDADSLGVGTDETLYSEADDVTDDIVLSQQNVFYYGSRAVVTASYQRSAASTARGMLTPSNSFAQIGGTWYDLAGRPIASASYGRDTSFALLSSGGAIQDGDTDGIPNLVESGVPSLSSSLIRSTTSYDVAGRVEFVSDNAGRDTFYEYDLLSRQTKMVENYDDGVLSENTDDADTDRTTLWEYDAWGRLYRMRAGNPLGTDTVAGNNHVEYQDTQYFYSSDVDRSWVTYTVYPDRTDAGDFDWDSSGKGIQDTAFTGDDYVTTIQDRLGRTTTSTDQRGTVHDYTYDTVTGQLKSDVVTTLGDDTDGAIRAVSYAYDDVGRANHITSYSNVTMGSSIANDVLLTFDGWGNVIKSQQDHDSAVDTVGSGTPDIEYTYEEDADGTDARFVRLSKVTYPDGREVFYLYGPTDSVYDKLSRVYEIGGDSSYSNSTYDARYSYIGVNTIIREKQTNGNIGLDYDPAANGSLTGLDTFGRVVNQLWQKENGLLSPTQKSLMNYAYDASSNRTSKTTYTNEYGTPAFVESYSYDGLNRLSGYEQNVTGVVDPVMIESQNWGLDALGNWSGFNEDIDGNGTDELVQTREHNSANEITSIGASTGSNWDEPAYDTAGNMTSMPIPGDETNTQNGIYDAWNRLVIVKNEANTVTLASYEFDGLGRRIAVTGDGDTTHNYYSESWQVLQTDSEDLASPSEQNIWSLRYIDALIRQDKRIDDGSTANAFGEDGISQTDINDSDFGRAIAVQSDGKVIVAGSSESATYLDITVVRYNTDGTLDTSFSGDGIYTQSLSAGYDEAYGVAIDSNGKIVLGGRAGTDSFVMRLTSSGTLDTTFGTGSSGYNLFNLDATSWFDSAYAMTLDSNGKILLAGSAASATSDFVVARVLANGSGLDTTFGSSSSGVRVIDFGSGTETAYGIDTDSNGNVIVVGESGGNIAIARLTSSGGYDTNYSGDGMDTILPSGAADAHAQGVTIDSNDKIIFTGYRGVSTGGYHLEMMVARLNTNGSADTTFSSDGYDYYAGGGTTQGYTVNLQTDGKIIIGGLEAYEATLWRYNTNGTLDTNFDGDGKKGTNLDIPTSSDRWVAVAHNGTNLFIGGFTDYNTTAGSDFAVMKLNAGVGLNQTVFFQQDANANVTSITDANGKVLERYRFTPYGERTVLNADFTVNANATLSDYNNSYGHQGGNQDLYTGLILFRNREYSALLGRWLQRDPIGYSDGGNLYQLVSSRPVKYMDPYGLEGMSMDHFQSLFGRSVHITRVQWNGEEKRPEAPTQPPAMFGNGGTNTFNGTGGSAGGLAVQAAALEGRALIAARAGDIATATRLLKQGRDLLAALVGNEAARSWFTKSLVGISAAAAAATATPPGCNNPPYADRPGKDNPLDYGKYPQYGVPNNIARLLVFAAGMLATAADASGIMSPVNNAIISNVKRALQKIKDFFPTDSALIPPSTPTSPSSPGFSRNDVSDNNSFYTPMKPGLNPNDSAFSRPDIGA